MIRYLAAAASLAILAGCALPPASTAQASASGQQNQAEVKEHYTGSRIPVKVPQRPLAEIDRHTFDEFRQNQRAAGGP